MNIRNTLVVLAATAGLATTLGATAATTAASATARDTKTRSVIVRYHARDLNSSAGAERLLSRVSGAATRVCWNEDRMGINFDTRSYRQCRANAISHAVAQIDRPMLTAAYNQHFGNGNVHPATALAPRQARASRLVAG